jgi:hypothetical protein
MDLLVKAEASSPVDYLAEIMDYNEQCMPDAMCNGIKIGDLADNDGEGASTVCRVCGDSATGMYFGALVCVPCKVVSTIY